MAVEVDPESPRRVLWGVQVNLASASGFLMDRKSVPSMYLFDRYAVGTDYGHQVFLL